MALFTGLALAILLISALLMRKLVRYTGVSEVLLFRLWLGALAVWLTRL